MRQTPDNSPGISGEYNPQEQLLYALNRRVFLDVIWNRIGIIEFRSTSLFAGQVYLLPKQKDHLGRLKVCLTINPDESLEYQEHTLVHECIHVDRSAWEKRSKLPYWSNEIDTALVIEEELTNSAADAFYETHKPLVAKALNHLRLRSSHQTRS